MRENERTEINELIEVLKGLDEKDLTLLKTGADILAARREMDRQENKASA